MLSKPLATLLCSLVFSFLLCLAGFNIYGQARKNSIQIIQCQGTSGESYVLYMPSGFNAKSTYPLVIFLDSHGKGNYPVNMYKSLADKYNIIIAGSNNIQNGTDMQKVFQYFDNLYNDLKKRAGTNISSVNIAGFSGGARMASVIALKKNIITNIIACSAGIDINSLASKPAFNYIGITGIRDMNYSELVDVDNYLENIGANHQLLVFNGKHEWPPLDVMDDALLYIKLNGLKKQKVKDESLIKLTKTNFDNRKVAIQKTGDKLKLLNFIKQEIFFLSGLTDVSGLKKEASQLAFSNEVKAAQSSAADIQKQENEYKQTYAEAMRGQPLDWWQNEITRLSQQSSLPQINEAAMFNRLLGYISLMSYSYTNYSLRNNQMKVARHFLDIYFLADPSNPDCYYFQACYYAALNDKKNALSSLQKSIKLGFSDKDKIKGEAFFAAYKNDKEFKSIAGL